MPSEVCSFGGMFGDCESHVMDAGLTVSECEFELTSAILSSIPFVGESLPFFRPTGCMDAGASFWNGSRTQRSIVDWVLGWR